MDDYGYPGPEAADVHVDDVIYVIEQAEGEFDEIYLTDVESFVDVINRLPDPEIADWYVSMVENNPRVAWQFYDDFYRTIFERTNGRSPSDVDRWLVADVIQEVFHRGPIQEQPIGASGGPAIEPHFDLEPIDAQGQFMSESPPSACEVDPDSEECQIAEALVEGLADVIPLGVAGAMQALVTAKEVAELVRDIIPVAREIGQALRDVIPAPETYVYRGRASSPVRRGAPLRFSLGNVDDHASVVFEGLHQGLSYRQPPLSIVWPANNPGLNAIMLVVENWAATSVIPQEHRFSYNFAVHDDARRIPLVMARDDNRDHHPGITVTRYFIWTLQVIG